MVSATSHPWLFGWDALVALGTILLALGTFSLAWFSRRDLEAQFRPVVWADERPQLFPKSAKAVNGQRVFVLHLINGGKGPALDVEAKILSPKDLHVTQEPRLQSLAVGEAGRPFEWVFLERVAGQTPLVNLRVRVRYSDVRYRSFTTMIDVLAGPPPAYGGRLVKQHIASERLRDWFVRKVAAPLP